MKKYLMAIMLGIMATFIVSAAPNSSFTWSAPTNYEDGTIIPATDILSYSIYCSATQGGPYNNIYPAGIGQSISNVDIATCVQGIPGTYYFVATTFSPDFNTESLFSNEVSRTYTAQDLGKVPNAPVLLSVQ